MFEPPKTVCAVVPIRDIATSKSRLADILAGDERKALVAAMAQDVIMALKNCPAIDHVIVATDDPQAGRLAKKLNCKVWPQGQRAGLSATMNHAASRLKSRHVSTMLSVHADLPLANAAAFGHLMKHLENSPHVLIVPSPIDGGSNVIVTTPPDMLTFQYGHDSYHRHLDYCQSRGIPVITVRDDDLGVDIDTKADMRLLLEVERRGRVAPKTKKFLTNSPSLDARLKMLPDFQNHDALPERLHG